MRHVIAHIILVSSALVACDTTNDTTATATIATSETELTADVDDDDEAPFDVCAATTDGATDGVATARLNAASCQVDADCTVAWAVTGCGEDLHAVSFAGAAGFAAEVAMVDAQLCADRPASCAAAVADWAVMPTSLCVAGSCELMRGDTTCTEPVAVPDTRALAVLTVESCLDCDQAAGKARNAIAAEVDAMNACESDAECVVADDSTGCGGTCGVAINAEHQADFVAAVDGIDADYCSGECPLALPGCMNVTARCVASRCTIE